MSGVTRIAPTPSGYLHAGNAIGFLLTSFIAQRHGLRIRLRIDDLDAQRVRQTYLQDIFDSLHWLGIGWDDGPRNMAEHQKDRSQGARLPRYHGMLNDLRDAGVLYGCTCGRSKARGKYGVYAGHCADKGIDLDDPAACWRIRLPRHGIVTVPSIGNAPQVDLNAAIGDVVLRQRAHGNVPPMPVYQIASLADDVDHGTTVIVRGMDLLPSSGMQLYLAGILGLRTFKEVLFVHHPLVLDEQGRKLSKSAGSSSLLAMRERGEDPSSLRMQAEALYTSSFS